MARKCKLVMCEGPDGRMVVRPSGKCPSGYIEKIATKLKAEGARFDPTPAPRPAPKKAAP